MTDSIILCHLGYHDVTPKEYLEALPAELSAGDRRPITIDQRAVMARALGTKDWAEARRQVVSEYEDKVKPLLDDHPAHRVQYFGTASVSLMMLLGFRFSTWRASDTYLHHHQRKNWKWDANPPIAPEISIDLGQLPRKPVQLAGDVVIRIGTSYPVAPSLTQAIVPSPIAEIDICVAEPGLDVLPTAAAVDEVGQRFREALDAVHRTYPNVQVVHVFAAVQTAVAFRLGTVVSPTIHPRIQTYEFAKAGASGGYYPALMLQDDPRPQMLPTPEEEALIAVERSLWQQELERLQQLAALLTNDPKVWAEEVDSTCPQYSGFRWKGMPSIRELIGIRGAQIDASTLAGDEFWFDTSARKWFLGDSLLLAVLRRFKDESERRIAVRLFLLHESVHDSQALTTGTAAGIGFFSKVLEEIDYQADAWSLLYEHRLLRDDVGAQLNPSQSFQRLVRIAMDVMMAFDDVDGVTEQMQTRRIARYLIWAWQHLELGRASTLEQCLAILCEKPVIDLVGLETRIVDRRVVSPLSPPSGRPLELAVLRNCRMHRFGLGGAAPLQESLRALREHQPLALIESLRGVADAVLTSRSQ